MNHPIRAHEQRFTELEQRVSDVEGWITPKVATETGAEARLAYAEDAAADYLANKEGFMTEAKVLEVAKAAAKEVMGGRRLNVMTRVVVPIVASLVTAASAIAVAKIAADAAALARAVLGGAP